ncbi:Uncharacterised protein [Mycobacteroides abscessus subsp. abscessus]|nr:Uncharacterised protein [Mycobacteroides abscessus subsp. abscessus]
MRHAAARMVSDLSSSRSTPSTISARERRRESPIRAPMSGWSPVINSSATSTVMASGPAIERALVLRPVPGSPVIAVVACRVDGRSVRTIGRAVDALGRRPNSAAPRAPTTGVASTSTSTPDARTSCRVVSRSAGSAATARNAAISVGESSSAARELVSCRSSLIAATATSRRGAARWNASRTRRCWARERSRRRSAISPTMPVTRGTARGFMRSAISVMHRMPARRRVAGWMMGAPKQLSDLNCSR